MTCLLVLALLANAPDTPVPPSDADRARWTMSDMQSLATAIEAYAIDHEAYPAGTSLEGIVATIQPSYIRTAPTRDAWGRAYLYRRSADGTSYQLVSLGCDGLARPESWDSPGELAGFDEDAVLAAGRFVRPWPFR